MKVLKKSYALIMALSIVFSSLPVFNTVLGASAKKASIILYEDFNSYVTGARPNGQGIVVRETESKGTVRVNEYPSAEDKSVKIENTTSDSQTYLQKQLTGVTGSDIVIGFKINVERLDARKILPTVKSSNGESFYMFYFTPEGEITTPGAQNPVGTFKIGKDEWVELKAVLDLEKSIYSVYVNGKLAAKNLGIGKILDDISLIRFQMNACDTAISLDDFIISDGSDGLEEAIAEYKATLPVPTPDIPSTPAASENTQTEDSTDDTPVSTEPKDADIVLYEDFNSYKTDAKPNGQGIAVREADGLGTVRVKEFPSAEDKSVKLDNTSADSQVYLQRQLVSLTGADIVIGFKVNVERLDARKILPTVKSSNGESFYMFYFDTNGEITTPGAKEAIGQFTVGGKKWVEMKAVLNLVKGTYSVYVDGVLKGENLSIGKNLNDIVLIRFQMNACDTAVSLDDFIISDGSLNIEKGIEAYLNGDGSSLPEANPATSTSPLITSAAEKKEIDKIIGSGLAMAVGSRAAYLNGEKKYIDENPEVVPTIINSRTMVPVRFISESFNAEVEWNGDTRQVTIKGSSTIVLTIDSTTYTVDGVEKTTDTAPVILNDRTLLPLRLCAENLGKKVYWNDVGLIIIGDSENPFDNASKLAYFDKIYDMVRFTRPDAAEIEADMKKTSAGAHPRLLLNAEGFENMKKTIETDETLKAIRDRILVLADNLLYVSPVEYAIYEEFRLGNSVSAASDRIEKLSMAYKLTGDEKYAQRAAEEMEAVCGWPDWNAPRHFLDTGGMLYGMAIGYDWCFDYLSAEQKTKIENKIIEYGLAPAYLMYLKQYDGPLLSTFWITADHNWNPHCNLGVVSAALALDGQYENAGQLVSYALRSFEYLSDQFNPDGGGKEGPGYWGGTFGDSADMLAVLESVCGTDYNYINMKGYDRTVYYPNYITGPLGTFAYSDGTSDRYIDAEQMFYVARRLNSSAIANMRKELIDRYNIVNMYDLIYYPADLVGGSTEEFSLDMHFTNIETATMRNAYTDDALFVGIHSGDNAENHAHYDTGTFILDALGERWFDDLGTDRVTYAGVAMENAYRTRAEGHNVFILSDPDAALETYPGQEKQAFSHIETFVSKTQGAYAITDMSAAYSSRAESAKRGVGLFNNRSMVIVRDEVVAKDGYDYYWFAHTKADITVSEDKKGALLTIDGKNLWAQILSDEGEFSVMDAVPLPNSPNPDGQQKNAKKLTVHIPDAKTVNLSVAFIPLGTLESPVYIPEEKALSEWSVSDGEAQSLSGIYVDGQSLLDFSPQTYSYTILLDEGTETAPIISVDDPAAVITQADSPNSTATIKLNDTTYYTIFFRVKKLVRKEVCGEIVTEEMIKTSSIQQPENPPVNLIDGSLDTRFAAEGNNEWFRVDLGKEKTVDNIQIAFMKGDSRIYKFKISVSTDGVNFTEVFDGTSTGTTNDLVAYSFAPVTARYIKCSFFGSNENSWNSITEIQ